MMTRQQADALTLLATEPQRSTAASRPGYIAGTTAHALQRRGWAAFDGVRDGCTWWRITDAGLIALAHERAGLKRSR